MDEKQIMNGDETQNINTIELTLRGVIALETIAHQLRRTADMQQELLPLQKTVAQLTEVYYKTVL